MTSVIVGLCMGHDPSVAFVREGEVVFAIEQEKCSGKKHELMRFHDALKEGFRYGGWSPRDVALIAIHADPSIYPGFHHRTLPRRYELIPFLYLEYLRHMVDTPLWKRQMGFLPSTPVVFIPHHRAHAAESFFQSGFSRAAILVVDGRGETSSTSWWVGNETNLVCISDHPPSSSIGYFYLLLTSFLGFRYGEEYKVMGLASYGNPRYKDVVWEIFHNTSWIRSSYVFRLILHAFRMAPHPGKPLTPPFSHLWKERELTFEEKADIASSLQHVTERLVLSLVKDLASETSESCLCVSGGVFQNAVLNGKIVQEEIFEKVFVSSCPHDAGTAVGAALCASHFDTARKRSPATPFVGPRIDAARLTSLFRARGMRVHETEKIEEELARLLAEGEIVGLVRGRAEFGPRALGHRSILANPSHPDVRDEVNRIKGRELFRPLAPSVKAEDVAKYFDPPIQSPFMSFVVRARDITMKIAPAIVHVDGTARIHTVEKHVQPAYWNILDAFEKRTGFSILLNTSLNRAGFPLAATEREVIAFMEHTPLSYLAIENYLVEK